jgi:hypothetical protein
MACIKASAVACAGLVSWAAAPAVLAKAPMTIMHATTFMTISFVVPFLGTL